MAECHPVGFQWVMEAKARGATVIHIDPRFTRTSAVADRHVPIRVGSDIAFLGGIINYILQNEKDFREYVVAYTNASTLVREDFVDTEDLDGLFSGYDDETGTYDGESWQYQGHDTDAGADETAGGERGQGETGSGHELGGRGATLEDSVVERDETLQHPRCVYQVLKRHYARYTPEVVQEVCGVPPEQFLAVCEAVTRNSGRERTTAWVYSVGWTHHSTGVQYIRGSAIIQLLLGNMGRPGGGIMALRGHASIQGSTDIPTLFNLLPGYLPMPKAGDHDTLDAYVASICKPGMKGFWTGARSYIVSLLKAWYGDAATAENDYAFGLLPKLTGDHGTYQTVVDQIDGTVEGYFLVGQNPAVGSAQAKMQRAGLANLKWLVVRDVNMIESATFWKDGPEIATGEMRTEDIDTEVFFLPAATHVEKAGSFTQTQRMVQWRHKAVEPPGDARSELDFYFQIGKRIRERLAGSTDPKDRMILDLTWDYPVDEHGEPDPVSVLAEVNGRFETGEQAGQPAAGLHRHARRRLDVRRLLDLQRHLQGRHQPGGPAQARPRAGLGRGRVGLGLADGPPHALQPRLGRPRGQAVERAQGLRLVVGGGAEVGRARRAGLRAHQAAVLPARARHRQVSRASGRRRPVHHAGGRQGLAVRAVGAARRPDAGALRAARVAGEERRCTASRRTRRARSSSARTT